MKYLFALGTLLIGVSVGAASSVVTLIILGGVQIWGADGSGRVSIASQVDETSSAIDLWPTYGKKAVKDSIAEITLHRTAPGVYPMERFNISAMADGTNSRPNFYRFGVEGDTPEAQRGMIFCFESFGGERANCRLIIDKDGVWVNESSGENPQKWKRL